MPFLFWNKNTELDALEADMESEADGMPTYLQPKKEPNVEVELDLPAAPSGHAAAPARPAPQV